MFNLYQYERLEKDEVKRQATTAGQPKKLAKYLKDRDELADRYKQRIVEFMENAAEEPDQYLLPDEFKGGVQAQNEKMMMYGRERFKYTTNSKDVERIMTAESSNRIYDTQPLNITEVKAWNLRPRSKDMELGPEVRFKSKLQMERIYDHLTSKISPYFTDHAMTKPEVQEQMKTFNKSGQRQHQTFSATGFSSKGFQNKGFDNAGVSAYMASVASSLRDSRLGNNICVMQPQNVMNELHKKSHFKGVTSFLIGQEASMQFKQSEKLVEAFSHIAKSIGRRRESRDQIQNGPRANTTKPGARRNLNIVPASVLSQRGASNADGLIDQSSPLRGGDKKVALTSNLSPTPVQTGEDYNKTLLMRKEGGAAQQVTASATVNTVKFKQNNAWIQSSLNNDQLNFNQTMPQTNQKEEQDPKALTTNILKICNVIRPKHAKVSMVHKQTGRGGQGPMSGGLTSYGSIGNSSPLFSQQGTKTLFYPQPPGSSIGNATRTHAAQFTLLSPKSSVME